MAEQGIDPYRKQDFSGGMVTDVNESLRPPNAVALGLNVDFDEEIGSAVTRLGTFIVGGQMVDGKEILGLHNHNTPDGTSTLFSAINDTDDATAVIYDQAGSVVVTGLTANKKVRFLTFLGETLAINGSNAERSWNGTSWITTGGAFDLANMPGSNTCSLTVEFLDRVYVAGDTTSPSRLYFSSVPTSGAVSWTTGNGYVDIEPEDGGGAITALAKVPGYVLVFKERSMKRWNFNSAFPESLVQIGTPAQESVVMGGGLCGFYSNSDENTKGFYITNGDRPTCISRDNNRPIKKWVDAITGSVAGWSTDRYFAWSVGDITIGKQLYRNVVLRYNYRLNQWSVRTYPTKFTIGTAYLDDNDDNIIVAGDNDGNVIQLDKPQTYTDYVTVNGEPGFTAINFDLRTHQENMGLNQLKTLTDRLVFNTRGASGATPYVIPNGGEPVYLDQVQFDIHEAPVPDQLTGNYFEFGLNGTVQGGRIYIKEIAAENITASQNYA